MAVYDYDIHPHYSSKVLQRGSEDYERCRRQNANSDTPSRYPREIHVVRSVSDVSMALKRAAALKVPVGVRSGGHLFPCGALVHDGVLVDTTDLNRAIEYDKVTQEICFGPAVRVKELAEKLSSIARFFPHGHAPTVAEGGFLLAGGQGWFMRGWGATCQQWITRMEIVMPNGQAVIASRTENQDVFWAARGSGTGFFGVVTKFWGRTIPASQMWERVMIFEVRDKFEGLLTWAFDRAKATPKFGTDLNIATFYDEKFTPSATDEVSRDAKLLLGVFLMAYSDTQREAQTILGAYTDIPTELRACLLEERPVEKRTWDKVWEMQDEYCGSGNGQCWQINSILNDPSVPIERLIEAIKPAVCQLPTRSSSSFICIADIEADEEDAAFSLPQQKYISTFTGWKDPTLQPSIYRPMRERYKRLSSVACGMYVADYDITCDDANMKVMSDTALARFLRIRAKWDPNELFPNYKKFVETHDKINRLQSQCQL
ncbi:oxidoreductase, FAD-binding protein [Rhizodiscina lignyota]|uniref:Oxidoreductase, FAD-binding protein n=1 Tax=Rhizodiscina lignyota TaxID=1504668 RepID=A0A9P4MBM5_9PEZI|nr:oxidoreductase, FAD-binding protein [Rhizodiscina lignyota]